MSTMRRFMGGMAAVMACGALTAAPSAAADTAAVPTFTKDIAPIFQAKCETCHRPNSIAPMSLVTYEEARPWARSIKTRVETRQMPPWHIDRTVGIQKFKNDRSLSDAQIETIVRWVDGGAPRGNPADMPAPQTWPDESATWNFAAEYGGPPDLIVKSPVYTQRARANDSWWRPVIEVPVTEPRWVRAIEMRPSLKGRKVVHHAIARLQQEEPGAPAPDPDTPANLRNVGTFMEWAVGKQGEKANPNTGKLLLPGSRFHWDIHFSSADEDVTEEVEMGIYFYPKGQEPKFRTYLFSMGATGPGLDIPPNTVKATQGFFVLTNNARIESFQPHMHLRGKAMSLEAVLPDGTVRMLSHSNAFNFNWHNTYVYADDVAPLLPKGTIMKVTGWHDNTAANKANPDPNVWVGNGDRTVDEMAHAWVNVVYMDDADFKAALEERKALEARTTQQQ
jgi:hypothetical protein